MTHQERSPIYVPPSPVNNNNSNTDHHIIDIDNTQTTIDRTLESNNDNNNNNTNEQPTCRICLESDPIDTLISPCLCKGGSQYVHRECLDSWRATDSDGLRFKQCDICKFNFTIDEINDNEQQEKSRLWKYRLYVTRDVLLSIIMLCIVLLFFTLMIASIDNTQQHIVQLFPDKLQQHTYIIYSLCGTLVFLSVLGLIGTCIACSARNNPHHHNNDFMPPCYGWLWFTDCSCIEATAADNSFGLIIGVVLLCLFAILGAIIGVYFSVYATKQILKKHTQKLWLTQETKRYIVRDLHGKASQYVNNNNNNTTQYQNKDDEHEQLIV